MRWNVNSLSGTVLVSGVLLSDTIYILIIHPGDARKRLAAALPKLKKLNPNTFPATLKKKIINGLEILLKGVSAK